MFFMQEKKEEIIIIITIIIIIIIIIVIVKIIVKYQGQLRGKKTLLRMIDSNVINQGTILI